VPGPAVMLAAVLASSKDVARSWFVLRTAVDHAAVLSSKRPSVKAAAASNHERPITSTMLPKVPANYIFRSFHVILLSLPVT